MKTQTYAYVLQRAVELTGRAYPPLTEEANQFRGFMAQGLRMFWEMFPWSDLESAPQYFFASDYSASTTYTLGDVRYFPATTTYYQALRATTGNDPATLSGSTYTLNSAYWAEAHPYYGQSSGGNYSSSTTYTVGQQVLYLPKQQYYQLFATASAGTAPTNASYWGLLTPWVRQIDVATASPEIGTILGLWGVNPYITRNQNQYRIERNGSGIVIRREIPWIWVENRSLPPSWASDPSTVPYIFAESVALYGAGMMLKVRDGKVDLGNELISMAQDSNANEADKMCRQEMQTRPLTFVGR